MSRPKDQIRAGDCPRCGRPIIRGCGPCCGPGWPKRPEPCACCGLRVRKRERYGKLRVAHECRHGRWCPGGDPLSGVHANGPRPPKVGGCQECWEQMKGGAR